MLHNFEQNKVYSTKSHQGIREIFLNQLYFKSGSTNGTSTLALKKKREIYCLIFRGIGCGFLILRAQILLLADFLLTDLNQGKIRLISSELLFAVYTISSKL